MPRRDIQRIRNVVRKGDYDLTHHAVEEMAEDNLNILDVETAIFNGQIARVQRDDPRGLIYTINGVGINQFTPVGVVGRFKETGTFLIITVYKIT